MINDMLYKVLFVLFIYTILKKMCVIIAHTCSRCVLISSTSYFSSIKLQKIIAPPKQLRIALFTAQIVAKILFYR